MKRKDEFILLIYLTAGSILFGLITFSTEKSQFKDALMFFGIMGSMLLYSEYCKTLRNQDVYTRWFGVGILQIVIWYFYKEMPEFQANKGGSYLDALLHLPFMLISLKALDLLYLKLYNQHLVITSRHANEHSYTDRRELRTLDYVFSMIGAMVTVMVPLLCKF